MQNRIGPQRLVGEVRMFHIRVATAESKLKLLREQARQAKLRRKAAKRIAQRSRKQFKQSKSELAELRQALAKAEAKLFKAGGRALARKLAAPRPVTKTPTRAATKPKPIVRKPRPASPAAFRAPRKKPVIKRTRTRRAARVKTDTVDPAQSTPKPSDTDAVDPAQSTPTTTDSNAVTL